MDACLVSNLPWQEKLQLQTLRDQEQSIHLVLLPLILVPRYRNQCVGVMEHIPISAVSPTKTKGETPMHLAKHDTVVV